LSEGGFDRAIPLFIRVDKAEHPVMCPHYRGQRPYSQHAPARAEQSPIHQRHPESSMVHQANCRPAITHDTRR
jgi:hypothetical protein